MNTFEKMLFLKSTPLFSLVKEEALLNIAQSMQEEDVVAGKTVITKGEMPDWMYVIVRGKVKVHDEDILLKEMSSKDVFGELSIFLSDKKISTVTSLEDCLLLKINQADIFQLMEAIPDFSFGIIKFLCRRIVDISKKLYLIETKNL